jgi:predicted restriction endonuclease
MAGGKKRTQGHLGRASAERAWHKTDCEKVDFTDLVRIQRFCFSSERPGEKSGLEAAHIKSRSDAGPNRTQNGLLLRADIHRLFDDGYVTVDPNLQFVVSPRLREEFENGRAYYAFDGRALDNLPDRLSDRPQAEFIDWHNTEVYQA